MHFGPDDSTGLGRIAKIGSWWRLCPKLRAWEALAVAARSRFMRRAIEDKPRHLLHRCVVAAQLNVKHGCIGTTEFRSWAKSWAYLDDVLLRNETLCERRAPEGAWPHVDVFFLRRGCVGARWYMKNPYVDSGSSGNR
jgi:hypothetical protein